MNPIKMNAEKAVSMTMDWYSAFNSNKNSIVDFTTKQINKFMSYQVFLDNSI